MIWSRISDFIIKNRALLLFSIFVLTAIMSYFALKVELAYDLPKILPKSDQHFKTYENFKKKYGEDGNVMLIGFESDKLYQQACFANWEQLTKDIKKSKGIKNVVSAANLSKLKLNDVSKTIELEKIVSDTKSQANVDSLWARLYNMPFYEGFVFKKDKPATLMLITFDAAKLNSNDRRKIVEDIKAQSEAFGKANAVKLYYSGMPWVRTNFSSKVIAEMAMFMVLAFLVTVVILFLFFRTWRPVLYSSLLVVCAVAFSVAMIYLLGFKITILTGLIPPIIIVISIPNTIFFVNKYQEEFQLHGVQISALKTAIEKIGNTTFLANVTTSIGFFVFYFTSSPLLLEFGLVAAICIMCTWLIFLILVPILFSYSAAPSQKNVKHLSNPVIGKFLDRVQKVVYSRRTKLYWVLGILMAISAFGAYKIKVNGYVVDDLPANDPVYTDLKWIEGSFKGIVPIEVNVDTKVSNGVFNPEILTKIKVLQREFAKYEVFTKPVSVVEAIKFIYQSYRGGDPKYYQLPGALELQKLGAFAEGAKGKAGLFNSFVDSTRQNTRISFQMADIGTARVNQIVAQLQPKIDTIFNYDAETAQMKPLDQQVEAKITGNGLVFTEGSNYLLKNLKESTLLAIILVAMVMAAIFFKVKDLGYTGRMIYIAAIPSIVPLIITAGLMGYFGIDLKPSTILIFSIAFGISSDGTIYFLTKYKEEREHKRLSVEAAIEETISTTGISMFYTAIILFAGFFIFTASSFKGTYYLGLLVSLTLLLGMIANLILLPSFILTLDKRGKMR